MKKALIAMSGGVDSSVAALLMQQKGYECVGATMKLFENEQAGVKREKTCCSLDDVEDARSVAYRLHMPYYVFNFTANFEKEVMDRFVCAYEKGWTPNPCIDCNRYLKFEKLYLRMQEMQMDTIVTGHYARVVYDEASGRYLLKKGLDNSKDQSYVLYNLTQEQLAHTQFPVGELSKHEVREIAEANGFINADKPDSQDICFVPDGDYAGFIERYTGKTSRTGAFLNTAGEPIGTHRGVIHYTIGQRKGLGISAPHPLYVCGICPEHRHAGRQSGLVFPQADRHRREPDLLRQSGKAGSRTGEDPLPPSGTACHGMVHTGRRTPCGIRRAAAGNHLRAGCRSL